MNNQHRIVSYEGEELILVDEDDNELGYASKAHCHDGAGVLHRAFSLFLFNADGQLLLQQRSALKRLWPGYWSNSCCSHPRRDETMAVATRRRLGDELNISTAVEHVYQFCYTAEFGDAGSENELCHVYLGRVSGHVRANESEIDAIRYVSVEQLNDELARRPESFTPWFKQEWQSLQELYSEQLERYAI
ncbi:MAG: isopentenyl-diphosphate Delta-isomerase [Gammaproteobacteria bacterium]|nr:isopentenyl-diphosphate Delta-isomerase [Gammaproteobacteria bacterium]